MSIEFRNMIDKEELEQDSIKLQEYRYNSKMVKLVDKVKDELADTTDNMGELDMIYKFAERMKEEIE